MISHNSVAQLAAPTLIPWDLPATSKHGKSPEAVRHMLVSSMAVLASTAGRHLSVDSTHLKLKGWLGNSILWLLSSSGGEKIKTNKNK